MKRTIHVLILSAIVVGCREPPTPPSQKSVEQAWQRTDRAVQQAADTEQQTRHARRLRDIDRMRFQAESVELQEHAALLRGLLVTLSLVLLVALLWLSLEIRRRRILSAIVKHTLTSKGGSPLTREPSHQSPS